MIKLDTDRLVGKTASLTNAGLVLILLVTAMMVAWPRVTTALGMRHAPRRRIARARRSTRPPTGTPRRATRSWCSRARVAAPARRRSRSSRSSWRISDPGARSCSATTGKEPKEEIGYGQSLGLAGESVKIAPAGLRVRATPTLVLVNAQGQVLAAWEGVGPEKQQQQIAKTIQSIVN